MGGKQPRVAIDLNSADWHDGFETASAENCFNERHRIETLEAENTTLRETLRQIDTIANHYEFDSQPDMEYISRKCRAATGEDRDGPE